MEEQQEGRLIGEIRIRFPDYPAGELDHITVRAYESGAESMAGQKLTFAWVATDGVQISPESLESEFIVVPEPASLGLIAGALMLAALIRRRGRR